MRPARRGRVDATARAPKVFVALGSNEGDPRQNVLEAMDRLEELSSEPLVRSSLWESEPVDCPPGSPNFINAVVGLFPRPGETAESLLEKLLCLEKEFGRKPKAILNEPRPLDLDLISFNDQTCSRTTLILPHPRAHLRNFVLKPLSEIAPDFILPGLSLSAAKLAKALSEDKPLRKLS